jgi:hypothetical protein
MATLCGSEINEPKIMQLISGAGQTPRDASIIATGSKDV